MSRNVYTKERWQYFMEPTGIVLFGQGYGFHVGSALQNSLFWSIVTENTEHLKPENQIFHFAINTWKEYGIDAYPMWESDGEKLVRLVREVPSTP